LTPKQPPPCGCWKICVGRVRCDVYHADLCRCAGRIVRGAEQDCVRRMVITGTQHCGGSARLHNFQRDALWNADNIINTPRRRPRGCVGVKLREGGSMSDPVSALKVRAGIVIKMNLWPTTT